MDIDLNDPEVANAAVKIQSGFRGHQARKDIKAKQVCSCIIIESMQYCRLTISHIYNSFLTALQQITLENIVAKGELSDSEQFLLWAQCFQQYEFINLNFICIEFP